MKCPYCAEEIKDEAIKCKHCGSLLSRVDDNINAFLRFFHKETNGIYTEVNRIQDPNNNLLATRVVLEKQGEAISYLLVFILLCLFIVPGIIYILATAGKKYTITICFDDKGNINCIQGFDFKYLIEKYTNSDIQKTIDKLSGVGLGSLNTWKSSGIGYMSISNPYEFGEGDPEKLGILKNNISIHCEGEYYERIDTITLFLNINYNKERKMGLEYMAEIAKNICIALGISGIEDVVKMILNGVDMEYRFDKGKLLVVRKEQTNIETFKFVIAYDK